MGLYNTMRTYKSSATKLICMFYLKFKWLAILYASRFMRNCVSTRTDFWVFYGGVESTLILPEICY